MISIVIVNWNAGAQLSDVIFSIESHHAGLVAAVIIVDNASTDNSLDLLAARSDRLTFPLHIIRNKENRGFAAACNQGASLAENNKYLLFLNPDTLLFEKSLSVPFAFMEQPENHKVGICGIQLIYESGLVSRTCARFPSIRMFAADALGLSKLPWLLSWGYRMAEWDHAITREVDQLLGAFFFVRADLFYALKGFDERFFVYFEEVDFSYRVHLEGYCSVFLADAQAFHAGGGTSRQVKAARLFYTLRSRLLYGFKHFSRCRAVLLLAVTMLIEPVSRVVFSLLLGEIGDVRNTLEAYAMLWRKLPAIFQRGLRQT
jgi:GT2 family glycosyltransferase